MLELALGALFTLILGSFTYTWKVNRRLDEFISNSAEHLKRRITHLEDLVFQDRTHGP